MSTKIEKLETKYEIDVMITSKDRHTEVALLLQSLRGQTFQNWNVILLDNASGAPMQNFNFLPSLFNRIKLDGHRLKILRNSIDNGVCAARNTLIKHVARKPIYFITAHHNLFFLL